MFQRTQINILLTLIILKSIVNAQPAPCNDDIHCSVGFFCHTMTYSCHECLSCELLKRHPSPNENECIKSEKQCGPCFPGFINDDVIWGAMCLSPKNMKILTRSAILNSYVYILVTCAAVGVFLSIFIIHGIWNTRIIKVNVGISSCKQVSSQTSDPDAFIIKKDRNGFTA